MTGAPFLVVASLKIVVLKQLWSKSLQATFKVIEDAFSKLQVSGSTTGAAVKEQSSGDHKEPGEGILAEKRCDVHLWTSGTWCSSVMSSALP